MNELPRLKISGLGWENAGQLLDFEQAKYFPYSQDLIISVEDQVVNSFEEMVQLVTRGPLKNKDYVEVIFLPVIVGG